MAGPKTIGARIAAANDDDPLSSSENIGGGVKHVALAAPVLLRKEFHGKVDSLQIPPRHLQIAWLLGAACEHDGIEVTLQVFDRCSVAHVCIGDEAHAFRFHLRKTPVNDVLFQLELRNAVAQQPADAIRLLVHSDRVPGAAELLRSRQPRRPRAYDGYLLSRPIARRLRPDPALLKSALD